MITKMYFKFVTLKLMKYINQKVEVIEMQNFYWWKNTKSYTKKVQICPGKLPYINRLGLEALKVVFNFLVGGLTLR